MNNIIKSTFAIVLSLLTLTGVSQAAETVKSGSWTAKHTKVAGTWKITEEAGSRKLVLTDLKTKKAPDLKIFFSPQSVGSVSAKTATKGSFFLKKLSSNKGTQTYALPKDLDLSKYKSVLIHCEKFTKLWGAASL